MNINNCTVLQIVKKWVKMALNKLITFKQVKSDVELITLYLGIQQLYKKLYLKS